MLTFRRKIISPFSGRKWRCWEVKGCKESKAEGVDQSGMRNDRDTFPGEQEVSKQTSTCHACLDHHLLNTVFCNIGCFTFQIEEDERESTLKRANTTKEDTKTRIVGTKYI